MGVRPSAPAALNSYKDSFLRILLQPFFDYTICTNSQRILAEMIFSFDLWLTHSFLFLYRYYVSEKLTYNK